MPQVRQVYQEQLQTLHDELMQMSSSCVRAVQLAVEAVMTGDAQAAEHAREADEIVDQKERDIESLCLNLLLRQQPVAADFRRISAALKMITDLERIGDQASDIGEISVHIVMQPGDAADDLRGMAGDVVKMVSDSITAFTQNDLVLSRKVTARDDAADAWFAHIKEDLIAAIAADKAQGEYCLEILMASKYLERIGDHATNIAEWAEYSILGYRSKDGKMP